MIFELYYGDELIAADFGHPTNNGKTVYIATRFYNKCNEIKAIQPGFLLALVEIEYLRKRGCYIWDLGFKYITFKYVYVNINPYVR